MYYVQLLVLNPPYTFLLAYGVVMHVTPMYMYVVLGGKELKNVFKVYG